MSTSNSDNNDGSDESSKQSEVESESESDEHAYNLSDDDDKGEVRNVMKKLRKKGKEDEFNFPHGSLNNSSEVDLRNAFSKSLVSTKRPTVITNKLEVTGKLASTEATEAAIEEFCKLYVKILKKRGYKGTLFKLLSLVLFFILYLIVHYHR